MHWERADIIQLINSASESGARQAAACEIIGISAKTFQRWSRAENHQDGRLDVKHTPKKKLTALERQRIISVANEPANAHLPPSQIVPKLADEGLYIASESSFYRVLKAEKQLAHRQKSTPKRQIKKPRALMATAPNQLYSWDITYLPTVVRGVYLYLYLVVDIYSRKVVGWQVYEKESSALAADLMKDICQKEQVKPDQVILHSDNGSPMKGSTMLATLQQLGIIPSFSRPSVSNDNPYSESLFRTLKYRPDYPEQPFLDVGSARTWVNGFVAWYNYAHLHSAIKFVTPDQRHKGEDIKILAKRHQVYLKARLAHPERWSGDVKNWQPIKEVYLNPEKKEVENEVYQAA